MSTNSISAEIKQRQPEMPRVNNLVSTINGKAIKEIETVDFNPKWFLAKTSNGSRYWIHPESGRVLVIREL